MVEIGGDMGLLNDFFGSPDQTQALGLLGAAMMKGKTADGLLAANQFMAGAGDRQMKQKLAQMQIENYASEIEQRKAKTLQEQAERERQLRIEQGIPGLFKSPGFAGGEPVPQMEGGIPMFSRPMGAAPMQATPGGFDVQGALRLGLKPDQIEKYAGLDNIGRPKASRQMEVDDGRGGKRIALVDDFGREVAGFAGYTAPVQVNQGDRVTFTKPTPGASFPVGMSPSERDASARGWAGHSLAQQRFAMEQGNMVADAGGPSQSALVKQLGKPPTGYRWKMDGSGMEAIPGGPADIKAGELGAKAKARQESGIAQADSVLQEVRDAKGMVGWNTAGIGGALAFLPATEARDLAGKLQTIKANLGFDRLQQMRDQSPTGGALGQVAVQELASLQATVASLDQLQSPRQIGQALDKIEKHYAKWRDVMRQAQSQQGGASGEWGIQKVK
jgi:hypothetical protein